MNDKEMAEVAHKAGNKLVMIGQPITSEFVPKKTYISVINMMNPLAMIDLYHKHKVQIGLRIINDFPIDYNRNRFVDDAIASGADYLFFMDMDMTFPSNALNRLFEVISEQNPVVSGMYYLKRDPFRPVCGRYVDWETDLLPHKEKLRDLGFTTGEGENERQLLSWKSFTFFDKDKPFQADVIGMGCVLVDLNVFKKIGQPYFRYSPDPRKNHFHNCISEDMYFCAQLKKAGIPILIDPRVQCGHIAEIVSDNALYEACRDHAFSPKEGEDQKKLEKILQQTIDVREEQKKWGSN